MRAGLLGIGVALSLVLSTWALLRGPRADPPGDARAGRDRIEEIEARLRATEARLDHAFERFAALEPRPEGSASSSATPAIPQAAAPPQEIEELKRRLDALDHNLGRIALDELSGDEGRERILALVREDRQTQGHERDERREERARQALADFVRVFADEAGLAPHQRESVEGALGRSIEAHRAVADRLRRDNAAPERWGEEMRALRDSADAELKNILSPEQFERFDRKRPELRRAMRGIGGGADPDDERRAP